MRRSHRISLKLVPMVSAAFLAACEGTQQKNCVDQSGRVVADANCDASSSGASGGWGTNNPSTPYHWYWYSGPRVFIGNPAPLGGRLTEPSWSDTVRGGFGETAAAHAGESS
jgi:hypothetical protein